MESLGLNGINGYPVAVECFISSGLPAFEIVGLPDAAVKEARERVRAAIKNSGFKFPVSRITLNLAPADTKKIRNALRSADFARYSGGDGALPSAEGADRPFSES